MSTWYRKGKEYRANSLEALKSLHSATEPQDTSKDTKSDRLLSDGDPRPVIRDDSGKVVTYFGNAKGIQPKGIKHGISKAGGRESESDR